MEPFVVGNANFVVSGPFVVGNANFVVVGGGLGGVSPPGGSRGRSPLVRLRIRECGGCLFKFNLNKWTPTSEYLLALRFIV